MRERFKTTLLVLLAVFVLNGCFREDDPAPLDDRSREVDINDWIWEELSTYYFWEDLLVDTDRAEPDHSTYFNSLLYKDDAFSYISEDAKTLLEELDGEILALGFSPAFGIFSNTNNLFIIVEYVYPGSSAEAAGLLRGDIILKIDGEDLTEDNYLDLYDKSEFTVTLGNYEGNGIYETDEKIFVSSGNIEVNPIVYSEVKEIDGVRIGYLVYVEFLSGNNNSLLEALGKEIESMKEKGISELILDLRYNRGGNVNAAQYLGSLLAPRIQVLNRDVFVRFDYNDILENYYLDREGENSEQLFIRFNDVGYHLDLDRLIILTSSHTASASELLLVGLDPYMPVISIGEPTFGKFYGSFVIYDQEDPPRHNWAMVPVVLKYTNVNGFTDFINGIDPDYFITDNLLDAKSFGDISDPMLAQAISIITGNPVDENARLYRTKSYEERPDWIKIRKGNILKIAPVPALQQTGPIPEAVRE